jgi:hypothetical protein
MPLSNHACHSPHRNFFSNRKSKIKKGGEYDIYRLAASRGEGKGGGGVWKTMQSQNGRGYSVD